MKYEWWRRVISRILRILSATGALFGRIFMAAIFISSGLTKLQYPDFIVGYMKLNRVPAEIDLPFFSVELLYLSATIELVAGTLVLIGLRAREAALILVLYLVPVTIYLHAIPGGIQNLVEVMKNVAIIGGLLMLASNGPGACSIDSLIHYLMAKRRRARAELAATAPLSEETN